MAGKAKFDQEAAFKSIIGADRKGTEAAPDIDKALRRMALEEGKNLTESVNEVLRKGLKEYLK